MSRAVIMLKKKALVLGISSVLAGWAASDGLCAEKANPPSTPVAPGKALTPEAPGKTPTPDTLGNTPASDGSGQPSVPDPLDKWPPKNKMTIKDDKTETAITGISIVKKEEIISLEGGKLIIPNDVTITISGTTPDASIVGKTGDNTLTLTGTGQVSVAKDATGVQLAAGSLTIDGTGSIKATPDDALNTTGISVAGGTLKINGNTIKGSKAAIEIPAEATTGVTLNFQGNSAITGLGVTPVPALDASLGTGPVTVNIEGGTFTGDIIGSNTNTEDKITISATMGDGIKGSISNFETINIDGTGWTVQGWVEGLSTLTTSSAINNLYVNSQPPTPPQVPIVQPDTLYVVPKSNSLAVTTSSANGAITNLNISGTPKLTGSEITVNNITLNSSGWTLHAPLSGVQTITANNPTPASASPEPVVETISLSGAGAVSQDVAGTLNINSPIPNNNNPVKITATDPGLISKVAVGADALVGPITNVSTIEITGSSWESNGLVTNPETITVNGQVNAIDSVTVGSSVATNIGSINPGSLNVAFNEQADVNGYLNLNGSGTIGRINFANADNRPSLMYTPSSNITDKNIGNIEGSLAKADTLVLKSGVAATGLPKGFTGIEYASPPAEIDPNLKRLGLAGITDGTTIKTILNADSVVSPRDANGDINSTKSIPFTASGMPKTFYLKTSGTGSYSIDFRSADRPTTTFEIDGGTVTKLDNGTAKNDQLILSSGTLQGDVSTMSALSINGKGWTAPGTFSKLNSINVLQGGTLATLNVAGPPLPPEEKSESSNLQETLTVQTTSAQPMPVTVASGGTLTTLNANKGTSLGAITVADGGTLTTLYANEGASLGDIVGAQTTVNITKGASLGAITGASTVNIKGMATLGPITNAETVNADSLAFQQVQVGSGLPAGAKTGSTNCQDLILNTPTKAVALTTKSIGTLDLANGAKLGVITADVNNLNITGKKWSAPHTITMAAKSGVATVNIAEGVYVGGIVTTSDASESQLIHSPVKITVKPIGGANKTQALNVTTNGNIHGNLDFTGVPEDTTVTLAETGGVINGNITGAKNISFDGKSTLNGTINGPVNTVQVKGQLTALSKNAAETFTIHGPASKSEAPQSPTLSITKGGKLIINRSVKLESGSFHQDGEINIDPSTPLPAKDKPLVTANTITIGPDARVVFDSSKASAGQVLMAATDKVINRPVTVAATNEQYHHFYSILNSKDPKKMELATKGMQAYVCDLAASGGAPASAVRAVDVAVAPKKASDAAAQSRAPVKDPLNAFVVQRANNPTTAAKLAKQLTPNNTGSNITASRDAQQMSSKAIDTRNTNRRTGMNTGDMMESGGVWIQYAYNNAKQDEKDGVSGYKDKTNGFTLGADWELDPMFDAGVAYTYAKSDISGEGVGSGSTMDSKNHIFTLYGSYDQDDMFMDGMISYASGDNKGHRNVSGHRVQASYDSKSLGIGLSGGMTLPANEEWSWQPLVAFNYYRITTDDYRESAPLSHLAFDQVKNDNYTIMELGAGVRLMGDIQMDDLAFRPAFKLMVLHDFKDDPVTMTAHYAAGGESFVVHGAKRDTTRYQFAASVDMDLHDNMTLSFNYSHDWMDNFKSDGFIARLRYDF
ncbi:autotransporter domain-containing protein [Endozoicomonas acroporae]|uniref:autotransporter domain-containing protein n=1 Tax=Endozoicomonas acroporae TaxID=1701104 RepID=UPI003D7BC817